MGVLRQSGGSWVSDDLDRLDRQLREGDGLVWQGDRALSLSVGVLVAKMSGYDENAKRRVNRGDVVGRRLEVYRHTELGEDALLGHWRMDEAHRVLMDLIQMDPRSRGHVDVETRLQVAEAAKDKEVSDNIREQLAPMIEHQMLLAHDRANPRHTFRQVQGLRDEKKAEPRVA